MKSLIFVKNNSINLQSYTNAKFCFSLTIQIWYLSAVRTEAGHVDIILV